MMSGSLDPKNIRSSLLPLLALFMGLMSLIIFLLASHLKTLNLPSTQDKKDFESLYAVKNERISQLFSWLYSEQFKTRNKAIDQSLMNSVREQRLRLLNTLGQQPLEYSPLNWANPQGPLAILIHQSERLSTLVEDGQFETKLLPDVHILLAECKSLIKVLTQWQQPLINLKDRQSKFNTLEMGTEYRILMTVLPLKFKAIKPSVQKQLKRYAFAWYRYWSEESLEWIEHQSSTQVTTNNTIEFKLEQIEALSTVYKRTEALSPNLANLVYFRVQRLGKKRWMEIWQTILNEPNSKQSLDSVQDSLRKLYRFYQLPEVSAALSAPKQQLLKPTQVPESILAKWYKRLELIDNMRLARALQKLGFTHHSSQKALRQAWFIPLLSTLRVREVYLELKGIGLKLLLNQFFQKSRLGIEDIEKLREHLNGFKVHVVGNLIWQKRLIELERLFASSWRSLSGQVQCNQAEYDLNDSWKDLGIIDRLTPSIHLVSDIDKARLSQRIGRVRWGLSNHHTFRVSIYDEDPVTSADHLFTQSLSSIIGVLSGQKVKVHGCVYSIRLLDNDELLKWLQSP